MSVEQRLYRVVTCSSVNVIFFIPAKICVSFPVACFERFPAFCAVKFAGNSGNSADNQEQSLQSCSEQQLNLHGLTLLRLVSNLWIFVLQSFLVELLFHPNFPLFLWCLISAILRRFCRTQQWFLHPFEFWILQLPYANFEQFLRRTKLFSALTLKPIRFLQIPYLALFRPSRLQFTKFPRLRGVGGNTLWIAPFCIWINHCERWSLASFDIRW